MLAYQFLKGLRNRYGDKLLIRERIVILSIIIIGVFVLI